MTTDRERAPHRDAQRRQGNAIIGGFIGLFAVVVPIAAADSGATEVAVIGGLIGGGIGALIGWVLPKVG